MTDKRERIIDATTRLFVKHGTHVPTAKIAKEAGVSNGTLFNYFPTKQDLVDQTYLAFKQDMAASILQNIHPEMPIEELLRNVWQSYLDWALANDQKHQMCFLLYSSQVLSPKIRESADDFFKIATQRLIEASKAGIIVNVSIDYLKALIGAHLNTAVSYLGHMEMSASQKQDFSERSFNMMWNSLKP